MSSEKINVGPGQYTPGYVYGKDKSPSFRYHFIDQVWEESMDKKDRQYQVLETMNTDLILLSKKEGMISENNIEENIKIQKSQVLGLMLINKLSSNMDPSKNLAMDLVQD